MKEKEQLETGVKANSTRGHREKRKKTKEADNEITEIMDALSDAVTGAIFWRIAEEGVCLREDLETLDAVVEEGERLVRELREYGLIKMEKGTVALTEKGRKVLAYLDRERNDNGKEVKSWETESI